jgi:hypothetical protein
VVNYFRPPALVTLGEWQNGEAGEHIIIRDQKNDYVSILCRGEAVAVFDNQQIKISEGRLLGVRSVLVGEPTLFDVKLSTPSQYIRWSVVQLKKFTDQRPEIRNKFQSIVSRDLANTLYKIEKYYLNKMQELE